MPPVLRCMGSFLKKGEPQFCAKDVCDVLGYKKSRCAVRQLVNTFDVAKHNVKLSRRFLEVNTEIELEGSIVGFVETVVADVGKTDIVGEIGIEHVVADAAADADTTIKAAEVGILE